MSAFLKLGSEPAKVLFFAAVNKKLSLPGGRGWNPSSFLKARFAHSPFCSQKNDSDAFSPFFVRRNLLPYISQGEEVM